MKKLVILNNIRKLRFENGEMSQDRLAHLCGVSRQTINAIEASKYTPTLELAFKIAQVMSKELGEVFFIAGDDFK